MSQKYEYAQQCFYQAVATTPWKAEEWLYAASTMILSGRTPAEITAISQMVISPTPSKKKSLRESFADWLTTRLATTAAQLRGEKKAAYWKGYETGIAEYEPYATWEQSIYGINEKPFDWLDATAMAAACGLTATDIKNLAKQRAQGQI